MTVTIECISWLINVTDSNDVWWKHETDGHNLTTMCDYLNIIYMKDFSIGFKTNYSEQCLLHIHDESLCFSIWNLI